VDDTSILLTKIRKARRVYLIGNGGSYANAAHIGNDLLSCGIKAYTLDAAFLTATANDVAYEDIFARWIETLGEAGDLLIALSGSGTSKNITRAIRAAQMIGMHTHLVTHYLHGRDMQQSEEDQIVLGHELMRALKNGRTA